MAAAARAGRRWLRATPMDLRGGSSEPQRPGSSAAEFIGCRFIVDSQFRSFAGQIFFTDVKLIDVFRPDGLFLTLQAAFVVFAAIAAAAAATPAASPSPAAVTASVAAPTRPGSRSWFR